MKPPGPTFWLLDRRTGWRTAHADGVTADAQGGLRLQADPSGPRSLTSPDGSLGRLVLPDFVAVDASGRLFTLGPAPPYLRRFDPDAGAFTALPATGGLGSGARDLANPVAVVAAGRSLFVADRGNRRVAVFDTPTLSLRALWEPRDGAGRPVRPDHLDVWDPVSVDAGPAGGHVLDAAHGVVYRVRDPLGSPDIIRPAGTGPWRRLAVDSRGYLYLLVEGEPRLDIFRTDGSFLRSASDPGEVADRFDPPLVIADHRRRIRVPSGLLSQCPSVAYPGSDVAWFDATTGEQAVFAADEWIGPAEFARAGTWISGPLDSEIYRCQWHRIQLELTRLPAGSRLAVSTYTHDRELDTAEILSLPANLWSAVPDFVGPAAQAPGREPSPPVGDAAVLSREGRFLWLRLELRGDGYDTPAVASAGMHYPRRSYLELLPAVYSADDAARRFLERFLSALQTQLEPVEHLIRDVAALFDPAAAPPNMVHALSSWLAIPREGDWETDQHRNLLRSVPPVLRRRGTPEALRTYLRAYLENITGLELGDDHFPHLIEGYRERNHFWLTGQDAIGGRAVLWSPGKVARLQLDRYATVGKVRLVTTGDPRRDIFHYYAHRFRVVIPAPWVRTAADERMVRRAIEAEKPAHTAYHLALITPGIRVGRQSTVGLDTVIAAIPSARLACRHDTTSAPSRPPRGRLGVDTVLCSQAARPRDLRVPTRLESNATLL